MARLFTAPPLPPMKLSRSGKVSPTCPKKVVRAMVTEVAKALSQDWRGFVERAERAPWLNSKRRRKFLSRCLHKPRVLSRQSSPGA
jgi:hypothetical protein